MEQFEVVFGQLVGFAIMLVIGYICITCKVYGEETLNGIRQIIVNVGIPLMVFANATSGATRDDLINSGVVLVLAVIVYVVLGLVMWCIARIMRLSVDRGHVFQIAFMFGNIGFIGLPLMVALFPERGALYYALVALVEQALLWTYAVWALKPQAKRNEEAREPLGQRIRGIISPGLVAVVVSLLAILLGVQIPDVIISPLKTVGSMATPLSLMYIGGLFALRDWAGTLRRPELYVGVIVKMIIMPIAFYCLFTYVPPLLGFTLDSEAVHAITIISGMPTMATLVILAERERNHAEYAVGLVLLTMVASLFTLSAVSYLVF